MNFANLMVLKWVCKLVLIITYLNLFECIRVMEELFFLHKEFYFFTEAIFLFCVLMSTLML